MSVSLKDLQSSDEEEEEEEEDEEQQELTSENNRPDTLPININKTSPTIGAINESKKTWFKGHITKFSSKSSPSSSKSDLSKSLSESPDKPAEKRLTKVLSDTDIRTDLDGVDAKDGTTRREWIKGQFNSYLSKSKHYYNRNSASDATLLASSPVEQIKVLSSSYSSTSSLPEMLPTESGTPPKTQSFEAAMNLSSVSSNESHLPVWNRDPAPVVQAHDSKKVNKSPSTTQTSGKNTFSKSPKQETDVNTKGMSRLKFSDLLHANTSHSPNESMESTTTITTTTVTSSEPQNNTKENELDDDEEFTEIDIDYTVDKIMKEDLKDNLRPNTGNNITYYHLWLTGSLMCAYLLYAFPPFLSGVVTGSLVTYLVGCIAIWMISPSAENYDQYRKDLKGFYLHEIKKSKQHQEDYKKDLPNPEILRKPRDLKGWMCMTSLYNGVFERELTRDVYVVIHEEIMFLYLSKVQLERSDEKQRGKRKKKTKKLKKKNKQEQNEAKNDDENIVISFEQEIKIDLTQCKLVLKPDELPIRRIWNKKYPIELVSPPCATRKTNINMSLEELTLSLNDLLEDLDFVDVGSRKTTSCDNETVVYLFANTGREKEDWFYRMQLCISPLKHQVSVKNSKRLSDQPIDSYPHYMVDLINESQKVMQRNVKGKKMEPYLAWINVFLGRTFWDFWHDKYWTGKLHQKIQSRLSKINTPPFITDIRLKDLCCGHNIPIIHKGSVPVLDEYGVWTDLQVTYKGFFTLTLETQLNVDYYVGLVSGIVKQKSGLNKDESGLSKMTKLSGLANESQEDVDVSQGELHDGNEMEADEIPDVYFDAFDNVDGNEELIDPIMADPRTKAFLDSKAGKKVVGLVGWLAKSKLAKKVAETDFAKKAYEKAYEKFRKMPIILKVEIQSLKGNLAINIPPPPTNRIWYGFRNNPVIFITASPKVGDKQVRLNYLTSWIERKLKEEFKKYLVLPSMQDFSIKLMDSQLHDLYPDRPTS